MLLPAWLLPDAGELRDEADVRPNELFTLADPDSSDETRLQKLIAAHIQTQGVWVLNELSSCARSLGFPLSLDALALAYPLRLPLTATLDDLATALAAQTVQNQASIDGQTAQAQLVVKNLVIAKLHYGINGEEAKERAKNYYITAQTLLSSLKKQIVKFRREYLANALDPFA